MKEKVAIVTKAGLTEIKERIAIVDEIRNDGKKKKSKKSKAKDADAENSDNANAQTDTDTKSVETTKNTDTADTENK